MSAIDQRQKDRHNVRRRWCSEQWLELVASDEEAGRPAASPVYRHLMLGWPGTI